MHEVPECLSRRYEAVDELIQELGSTLQKSTENDCPEDSNPGIKLMCDFWSILKEDPNCDLPKLVQKRMCPESPSTPHCPIPSAKSSMFGRAQRIMCYMANDTTRDSSLSSGKQVNNNKNHPCQVSSVPKKNTCCVSGQSSIASHNTTNDLPLSKVLCNLKQAVSYDKKCSARVNDLLEAEKTLQGQIAQLEDKERQGVVLLKQADCMWSCMENAYKEKIADSLERQKCLLQQLKDVEKSVNKWRKNKKDLESQLDSIGKAQLEINEKISRKTNDIKSLNVEIDGFKKRIEANKRAAEAIKKSIEPKKKHAKIKIETITAEMKRLEALDENEKKAKLEKDAEGAAYIKEAREDLQKICKALLQKQLEKEDLTAEKKSLIQEIDLLKTTCDLCKDKCKRKQELMGEELNKVEAELAIFKVKCIKCNQCTDTSDQRYYCNDCPRCAAHRECLVQGDTCGTDIKESCVCQMVKQKLLDNIFENMYTVLDRQVHSRPGKVIADQVLKSLKHSRNGKLNTETKKVLQEFILTTIKKNLNLTIVGGAVKTRCELDPDTYNQLMLCLKQIKASRVAHSDKGTESKKGPCKRWGGSKECYCPKGPKDCVCIKKAPPPKSGKGPCPPLPVDKEDEGEVMKCPNKKDTVCGLDCSMHTPERIAADVSKWKPDPCGGPSCPYSKNMRAAQCVFGPELFDTKKNFESRRSIAKLPGNAEKQVAQGWKSPCPIKSSDMKRNSASNLKVEKEITCKCGDVPIRFCSCHKDRRSQPCQNIIDEVIGRYMDVAPIQKVTSVNEEEHVENYFGGYNPVECVSGNKENEVNTFKNNLLTNFCIDTSTFQALMIEERNDSDQSFINSFEGHKSLNMTRERETDTEMEKLTCKSSCVNLKTRSGHDKESVIDIVENEMKDFLVTNKLSSHSEVNFPSTEFTAANPFLDKIKSQMKINRYRNCNIKDTEIRISPVTIVQFTSRDPKNQSSREPIREVKAKRSSELSNESLLYKSKAKTEILKEKYVKELYRAHYLPNTHHRIEELYKANY